MPSILGEVLHFVSKELLATRESSVEKKLENMLLQGLCVYNYNQICEVLKIKTMTEGYDDHSPQTIPLKTMHQKKL